MSATDIIARHPEISTEVSTILKLCEKGKLQGYKDVNLKDPEFIALYVSALVAVGIEPGMVSKCIGSIMSQEEFFPRPATLCKYVVPYRDRALEERRENRLQGLLACEDLDGMPWLAPQDLVADGTYIGTIPAIGEPINAPELPECSAPALGMRAEVADRLKQLEGRFKRATKRNKPAFTEGETVNIEAERDRQIRQARGQA